MPADAVSAARFCTLPGAKLPALYAADPWPWACPAWRWWKSNIQPKVGGKRLLWGFLRLFFGKDEDSLMFSSPSTDSYLSGYWKCKRKQHPSGISGAASLSSLQLYEPASSCLFTPPLPKQGLTPPLQDTCMVNQLPSVQDKKQSFFLRGNYQTSATIRLYLYSNPQSLPQVYLPRCGDHFFLQQYLKEISDELSSGGYGGHASPRLKKATWASIPKRHMAADCERKPNEKCQIFDWMQLLLHNSCSTQNIIFS